MTRKACPRRTHIVDAVVVVERSALRIDERHVLVHHARFTHSLNTITEERGIGIESRNDFKSSATI